jgi:hypothetical protein
VVEQVELTSPGKELEVCIENTWVFNNMKKLFNLSLVLGLISSG